MQAVFEAQAKGEAPITQERAMAKDQERALLKRIALWAALVAAQDKLLVAYRLGRRPSDRTLDAIHILRKELNVP